MARAVFAQSQGTIAVSGEGDVTIDGSGTMILNGTISTESGNIVVGEIRAPVVIEGSPIYIHTEGGMTITSKYDDYNVKVIETERGDVLRYQNDGQVSLEATHGSIIDMTYTPLEAGTLGLTANSISIITDTQNLQVYKNQGPMYIEAARIMAKK